MDFPGLLGPFYSLFSAKADGERAKNLYLERIESGAGRNTFAMYRSHGLKRFSQNFAAADLICRGLLELNDHVFVVEGSNIYDVISDGSINAMVGPIANDGLIVSINSSENSIFVVSANVLYRLNTGVLTQPVTPFIPSAVAVLSTYVIALEQGTNRFFFSRDDGQTWDAIDFQLAEGFPNALVNLAVDHQELWLFGNRRTQVFVVGTDPNKPFVPVSSAVIEMGLTAQNAMAKLDNSLFWLGHNRDGDNIAWRANGYSPVRVSNHAVENQFRSYGANMDASMATYQLNGHSSLRLTFPSAKQGLGATWEYDISTGQWFEVSWRNMALNRDERHRGNCYVSAFGSIIVGDHANGVLYLMSPDYNTDFGFPIRWERRAPHLTQDGKRIQYKRFGVFMQTGVGSTTPIWLNDQSIDPVTFAADLAALVAATTITQAQSNAMQSIYNYTPYDQDLALPDASVMTPLGFFDFGVNPMVGMRYSNDGGTTFGSTRERPMGRAGDTNTRIYWGGVAGLGMGRDRVWEISGMAAVKTVITQGTFEAVSCLS